MKTDPHHKLHPAASLRTCLLLVTLLVTLCLTAPQAAFAWTSGQPLDWPYPRLISYWPDLKTLSASDIARRNCVILFGYASSYAEAIKTADPNTMVLASSSASEVSIYTEPDAAEWQNGRLAALSAQWCVTQPGSTLSAPVPSAFETTVDVAVVDADRFRVGDVVVVDEEFLEVLGVNPGTPGALVVRRGAVVSGVRHLAAPHPKGARIAAIVREFPNRVLMDLTDYCPRVDVGYGAEDYNAYLTRESAALINDPAWDGIYFDQAESDKGWVESVGRVRYFDLDRSNTIPSSSAAFHAAWGAGVRTLMSHTRALIGDAPIFTNGANANWDLINGTTMEKVPSIYTTAATWRASIFGYPLAYTGHTYFASLTARQPNLSALLTWQPYTSPFDPATFVPDYRLLRFGLTTALIGDGLYDCAPEVWFDEYDNAGSGKGYLGAAEGPARLVSPPISELDLLSGDGAFDSATQLSAWTLRCGDGTHPGYEATKTLDGGAARVDVTATAGSPTYLTLGHPVGQVALGQGHTTSFRMRADHACLVRVTAASNVYPYAEPLKFGNFSVDTTWRTYTLTYTATASCSPNLYFCLGGSTGSYWIDDITMQSGIRADVWRRDFQNGISIVNASDGAATVDLGGTFRKIKGTQDPVVNDGSLVSVVTLPAHDGIILLRESGPSPATVSAPTDLAAVLQSGPKVALTWNDTATTESGFMLERSANGGGFAPVTAPPARPGTGLVNYVDTDVVPGDTYAYRVRAMDDAVSSAWCSSASVAVPEVPTAPQLSFRIKRTSGATDKVTLRWADVAGETGYLIERAGDTEFSVALTSIDVAADATSATDVIAHGSSYFYRIRASNHSGSSAWSAPIVVSTVPARPKGVKVIARTQTSITVAWSDASRNGGRYCIQRRGPTSTWKTVKTTGRTVSSWKNSGLARGRSYQYRILGFNTVGASTWSRALKTATLR